VKGYLSRLGFLAGACGLLVATLSIAAPKAIEVVATFVRDVDHPARHPFGFTCNSLALSNFTQCSIATVPAGRVFVIQGVSVFTYPYGTDAGRTASDLSPQISLSAISGGNTTNIIVPLTDQGLIAPKVPLPYPFSPTGHVTAGVLTTIIYADPNTAISCDVYLQNATQLQLGCTISGYWVSIP